jgi:polysaccharide export outer membrane protein
MRPRRLLVILLAALTLAACARQAPRYASSTVLNYSELDMRMYGAPGAPSYSHGRRRAPRYAAPPVRQHVRQYVQHVVPVQTQIFEDGPYTLDSGDKLRIVVFGQDTLSNNYIVDAEGRVALPLIGMVNARGLTTGELSAAIRGRLAQGYIREPSVAVEVEVYRPFFVLGEVTYPGQYPYVPDMTVENAIAIAGGFTPRASKDRVTVTRKYRGMPASFALPLRYPLRPGDTVTVRERWF